MKIGVIISSNDVETCWNALRYANFALEQKDEVKVFFMGKGVEYQKISTEKFKSSCGLAARYMPVGVVLNQENKKEQKCVLSQP